MRAAVALIGVALAMATAACSTRELTQLVVVSDSDLAVPSQLDAIDIEITPPSGVLVRRTAALSGDGASALPATLGVVHRGGALGPVAITVRGRRGTTVVVLREAQVAFIAGRTLLVELPLEASCAGVVCPERQTCARAACRDVVLRPEELPFFDGSVPHLGDAGTGCTPLPEVCNGVDDDCDGLIDEGFDLAVDPVNCRVCGHVCVAHAHSRGACVAGLCGVTCDIGHGDCDGDVRNGCETQLNTLATCAACGMSCAVAHGAATCFLGTCALASCAPGWGHCDASVAAGCEAPLNDPAHCGGCMPCVLANATASCIDGICGIAACDAGFGDCNGTASDGCEARLDSITACGACRRGCPSVADGTVACASGVCVIGSCAVGHADCDHNLANGCEAAITTITDCGACGAVCALPHASQSCVTGMCRVGTCAAGWDDCNGIASDGCETPLDTTTNCGVCRRTCGAASPVCGVIGASRACVTGCGALTLCTGTCADLATSLSHCGTCGQACTPAHAVGVCSAGACGIASCVPGFGDCNGIASDGCETSLDTLTDCGACRTLCSFAGASAACIGRRCVLGTCGPGLADCDRIAANGCETSIRTLANCGACGVVCAPPRASGTCATGTCQIVACDPGHADCNGLPADGCETALATLTDCRACRDVCDIPRATASCTTGTCALTACYPGWANCNVTLVDGCERSITTTNDCGACGVACGPFANASASCTSGVCLMTCATGYADCNGLRADGCEVLLTTASNCGACGTACTGATPVCTDLGGGRYGCRDRCGAVEMLCGAACANTMTSVGHCGACFSLCAPANATPACVGGLCFISSCNPGYGDCNGLASDGCERSTRTLTDCANCGTTCGPFANATASCTTGTCAAICASLYGNCDGLLSNGCERRLDTTSDCGGCGVVCGRVSHATPSCVAGTCTPMCTSPNRLDCNRIYSDGCETDVRFSDSNCGACGTVCASGLNCDFGVCA